MDPETTKPQSSRRRSSREELKKREPLKRKRGGTGNQLASVVVNGSKMKEQPSEDEDEESPEKKPRPCGEESDGTEIGEEEEADEHQEEMCSEDDELSIQTDACSAESTICSVSPIKPPLVAKILLTSCDSQREEQQEAQYEPVLRSRRSIHQEKRNILPPESRAGASQSRLATSQSGKHEELLIGNSSFQRYHEKMGRYKDLPKANEQDWRSIHKTRNSCTQTKWVNSLDHQRPFRQMRTAANPVVIKVPRPRSSRGCVSFCHMVCLFLIVGVLAVLGYWKILLSVSTYPDSHQPPVHSVESFLSRLKALELLFPNQQAELWRRSKIHLQRHLQTAKPTEPVSLILAAGRGGETTLRCLASHLASAFSSALNSSVLQVDGASKAGMDSDEVKLELDGALRDAFGGKKLAAVIHRLEELPPGSTLIFYRYCDHENAAYKQAFLAFTVLLPQSLTPELSLSQVEEVVQDYISSRLISPTSTQAGASFNQMDADKLSGLWSRISHLILPVNMEAHIEENGCEAD